MIPYEDLVIALQTWRAKQGLPIAQMSGSLTPPPVAPARATPPSAPPAPARGGFLGNIATPPPLAAPSEDSLDVEDAALIEEANYENDGDFQMAFGAAGAAPAAPSLTETESLDEATAIGVSPPTVRHSELTLDEGGTEVASESGSVRGTGRTDEW
jgi:hypothetical protein